MENQEQFTNIIELKSFQEKDYVKMNFELNHYVQQIRESLTFSNYITGLSNFISTDEKIQKQYEDFIKMNQDLQQSLFHQLLLFRKRVKRLILWHSLKSEQLVIEPEHFTLKECLIDHKLTVDEYSANLKLFGFKIILEPIIEEILDCLNRQRTDDKMKAEISLNLLHQEQEQMELELVIRGLNTHPQFINDLVNPDYHNIHQLTNCSFHNPLFITPDLLPIIGGKMWLKTDNYQNLLIHLTFLTKLDC